MTCLALKRGWNFDKDEIPESSIVYFFIGSFESHFEYLLDVYHECLF